MAVHEVDRERGGTQDLATSTLAEIYAQQGLLERARSIYERIAQRSPDDRRITERIESLTRAIQERSGAPAPASGAPGIEAEGRAATAVETEPARGDAARDEVFEAWLAGR